MTQEEACAHALIFLEEQAVSHEGYVDSRFLHAERFNRLLGECRYEEDFWVVEFKKPLPAGVLFESPATISVMVFSRSGRTCFLPSP